jgi:LPXTG-motif cell wall-anchored protein
MSNLLVHILVAQTYGAGTYGSLAYNASSSSNTPGPLVAIGPLTLPDTGAGWTVLISAAILAIAGGVAMWLWQRAKLKRLHEGVQV